jgi:anaerobic selenocysteine-containing dehydrogenase
VSRAPTRTVLRTLTRRDLLRLAQVGGIGAAGAALTVGGLARAEVEHRPGTCHLCTMHCGIVATVQGDTLLRIDGDPKSPTRGFVCLNGQGLREVLRARARLRHPLVRRGDHFEPIGWDEALAEIAAKLRAIVERRGASHVAVQTGWPFVRHPLVPYIQRLCDGLGTPNFATVSSLCEAAGRMGRGLTHGTNYWPKVQAAATVVLWGSNPTHSAAPYYHHLIAAAKAPRALVVVDPVRTELARHATHHLQVRPGTDGALALGMLRVLIAEDRLAHQPAELPALRALVEPYTPEQVEALTSVPAAKVVQVARLLVDNAPAAIWEGLGVEHHDNGIQTVRAISALYSLCGGLERTGDPRPAELRSRTPAPMPPPPTTPAIGAAEFPVFAHYQRQAQAQRFPAAIEAGELSALVLVGSNTLVTSPDAPRLARALDTLELLVVIDPFLTESAEHADYVLPTTTFAERPPLSVPPPGDVWPDDRVIFSLGRALGLDFPWSTLAEAEAARGESPAWAPPPLDASTLELRSARLEAAGQPGLPVWTPPADATNSDYPLRVITGPRTRAFINSQLHHAPSVQSKMPQPLARLHPRTAEAHGLVAGARVRVRTRAGEAIYTVEVTDEVHPEVVVVPHGWGGEANANRLTDTAVLDPISGFPNLRSRACRLERA